MDLRTGETRKAEITGSVHHKKPAASNEFSVLFPEAGSVLEE
jgi:hypothetical protein